VTNRSILGAIVAISLGTVGAAPADDLPSILARVGRQVEAYYSRARSIVCTERVVLQPLRSDFTPTALARHLDYELRIEWDPPAPGQTSGEAHIVRRLVSIGGRPAGPRDEPGCYDPKPVTPEPLAMFMPAEAERYVFTLGSATQSGGRPALVVDYREPSRREATITWKDDCATIDAPGNTRGRAWIDAETGDVLRLDEWLVGLVDVPVPRAQQRTGGPLTMTVERADSSILYRPVRFTDPDETMLLPSSVETFTIVRNAGDPRLRTSQTFSDYKRFVTGGRLVQ